MEFPVLQKKMAADGHANGFIDIWTPLLKVSGGLNATLGGNLSGTSLTVSTRTRACTQGSGPPHASYHHQLCVMIWLTLAWRDKIDWPSCSATVATRRTRGSRLWPPQLWTALRRRACRDRRRDRERDREIDIMSGHINVMLRHCHSHFLPTPAAALPSAPPLSPPRMPRPSTSGNSDTAITQLAVICSTQ